MTSALGPDERVAQADGNDDEENGEPANPPSAATRAEQVLARAAALFRLGGLAQALIVLLLAPQHFPRFAATAALLGAVCVESTVLIVTWLRTGRINTAWVSADVTVCCGGLVLDAGLTRAADGQTWAEFMYPFTIIAGTGIGLGFRRLPTVLGAACALATAYGVSAVLVHRDPVWNTVPNAISYFPDAVVAWSAAFYLRRAAQSLDASRARAVSRADELARERERARHSRMLHDRVLQTMETLARGEWVPDAQLRSHIAAEAAWLRALVEGNPVQSSPGDLLGALQEVARSKASVGLSVELNTVGLRETAASAETLAPETVEAVADAVREALTNVAKHAGVHCAVVRAFRAHGGVVVSVLDQGRGFDPQATAVGLGLEKSIYGRIAAVGGQARIESRPRGGTYVELFVPARAPGGTAA